MDKKTKIVLSICGIGIVSLICAIFLDSIVFICIGILSFLSVGIVKIKASYSEYKDFTKFKSFINDAISGELEKKLDTDFIDKEFSKTAELLNKMVDNYSKSINARSNFMSKMSHEIRTPINAITGLTEIAKKADDRETIDDCLSKITMSSEHLIGIINEILDFSKIESGKVSLDEDWMSISENIAYINSVFTPKAKDKDITFKAIGENIRHDGIYADKLRLNQVLFNFISNSLKFTDTGGKVIVTIEETVNINDKESVYKFTVADNGIGIDSGNIEKLFTPFMQANKKISRDYGGTGLGLVISKNIIEIMGGEIELETELGKGSEFSFELRFPSKEKISKKTEQEVIQPPNLEGMKMLVVDDNEINRTIAIELLKVTNIDAEEAENGLIAYEKFMESSIGYYNLILMDMEMPVMDGSIATQKIRDAGREDSYAVKIVALSANVLPEQIDKAMKMGIDSYIGKPVNTEEVFRVLKDVLKV